MEVKGLLLVVNHSPSSVLAVAAGTVFGGGGLGGGTGFFFSFTPVKLLSSSAILCSNPGSRGSSVTTRVPLSSVVIEIFPVYPLLTVVEPSARANVPSLTGIQTCRWVGRGGGGGCGWGGAGRSGKGPEAALWSGRLLLLLPQKILRNSSRSCSVR